jgi:FtsX-like permease family
VLAATRLRRDHAALGRRLLRLGARTGQRALVTAVEVVVLALVGTAAGWAAGAGAGALLARRLGAPGGAAVSHSALTGTGIALAAALAAATTVVVLVTLLGRGVAVAGMRFTVADVAALGALGAILLALARGKADATALAASGGTGVLLLLLPGLAIVALAVAAARLLTPGLRLLERVARRGPVSARVALLSLARAPGQATLSAVFFVVAVSVAVFAISYRATLLSGERQQAAYAVPADFVLSEDVTKLVTLQQAAPPTVAKRLGTAVPVLRDSGYTDGNAGRDFTVLALPASSFASIQGWRSDFSAQSPAALARPLRPAGSLRLPGLDLPASATELELPVTIDGDGVGLSLTVLDRRGDLTSILLGEHGRGAHVIRRPIPPAARGGRILALRVTLPLLAAFAADHRESGTALSVSDNSHGALALGRLRAGSTELADWPDWNGVAGLHRLEGAGARLRYVVNRAADSVFRPREPLEGEPVPVVVTPALAKQAGSDGLLPLHVDETTVLAQVVGVAKRIPSVDGDAVVADLAAWQAALTASTPGLGAPSEWWIDGARADAPRLLAAAPFSQLAVSSQRATYDALRSDPLARGTLDVLLVAAAVGLALAAIGVLLAVVGDLRDESGELYDLEAQGASPREVRRHLLLRAASVAGVGGAGGVAAGAAVGALVVSVVTVTAGATAPLPPLARAADWPLVLAALAALAGGSALAAYGAARGAFAAAGRRRFSEGLE